MNSVLLVNSDVSWLKQNEKYEKQVKFNEVWKDFSCLSCFYVIGMLLCYHDLGFTFLSRTSRKWEISCSTSKEGKKEFQI